MSDGVTRDALDVHDYQGTALLLTWRVEGDHPEVELRTALTVRGR